jgi:type VI secretion system secreted protein Hcp
MTGTNNACCTVVPVTHLVQLTGAHKCTTASSSGGATAERANFAPLSVSKLVDKASPKLWEACYIGKHIKEVLIQVYRSDGDKKLKYLEIKMEQVLIANFDQGGGGVFPTENISFYPGKISMTYTRQAHESGGASGNVMAGWDLTTNKSI